MTVARTAAAGALALAVALAVWLLLFRGPSGTEYTLLFQNAGQLVTDDDVQVGGRRVGSVREIELTDDNQAAIKVVVEEPYAPLREGTQAVIRLTSLSRHRQPLHRADARARRRRGAARGRHPHAPSRPPTWSTSTRSSTRSTSRRAATWPT